MAEILYYQAAANARFALAVYRMRFLENIVEGSVEVITDKRMTHCHHYRLWFFTCMYCHGSHRHVVSIKSFVTFGIVLSSLLS